MKRFAIVVLVVAMLVPVVGCKVYMGKDALNAAQTSTANAVEAARRANADQNTAPWLKEYTTENAKQWRDFVRSAMRDTSWGTDYDKTLGTTSPNDQAGNTK